MVDDKLFEEVNEDEKARDTEPFKDDLVSRHERKTLSIQKRDLYIQTINWLSILHT